MASLYDNDMEKNHKKFTWSKGIVLITGLIFTITLAIVFYLYIGGVVNTLVDVSVLGICVSVTGSIFGSNLCWYSKKSAGENHYKHRLSLYSDAAKIRLEYNKAMASIIKENDLTQQDLETINSSGDMDEFMDSALGSAVSKLDELEEESNSSTNSIETY